MSKQQFTITIYTENNVGLLNRIAALFSRRRINIESLNIAPSGVNSIHRFTIVISETEEVTKKLVLQIEKQVDVFKSFYHTNEEIVWQEQALYKVAADIFKHPETAKLLKEYGARQVICTHDYSVFETTGAPETTDTLVKALEPLGLTEFVKGARISIIRYSTNIHQRLTQFESMYSKAGVDNNELTGI